MCGEQLAARAADPGAGAVPVEQGDAELPLELADALAERRLGDVQVLAGPAQRAVLHDGREVLQLLHTHVHPLAGGSCHVREEEPAVGRWGATGLHIKSCMLIDIIQHTSCPRPRGGTPMTQTTSGVPPADLLARPPYRSELLDRLHDEWGPLFHEIASGTVQRELDGVLPFEAVRRLKDEGFGALRVPRTYGGRGATWPELTALWIELAAADANLAQALPRALRVRRGPPVAAPPRARPVGVVRAFRRRRDRRQRLDRGRARRRSTPRQTVLDPQVDGYRLVGGRSTTRPAASSRSGPTSTPRRHRHGQDDDFAIADRRHAGRRA